MWYYNRLRQRKLFKDKVFTSNQFANERCFFQMLSKYEEE